MERKFIEQLNLLVYSSIPSSYTSDLGGILCWISLVVLSVKGRDINLICQLLLLKVPSTWWLVRVDFRSWLGRTSPLLMRHIYNVKNTLQRYAVYLPQGKHS